MRGEDYGETLHATPTFSQIHLLSSPALHILFLLAVLTHPNSVHSGG